jgi:hypothetical protein
MLLCNVPFLFQDPTEVSMPQTPWIFAEGDSRGWSCKNIFKEIVRRQGIIKKWNTSHHVPFYSHYKL